MKRYFALFLLLAFNLGHSQKAHIPLSKNCEKNTSLKIQNDCTTNYICNYIKDNIPLDVYKGLKKEDLNKPFKATLIIDNKGSVIDFKSSSFNDKKLEKPIKKVVKKIDFIPATDKNGVTYKSHFNFTYNYTLVDDEIIITPSNINETKNVVKDILDNAPIYKGCENTEILKEQFLCLQKYISLHIKGNFNLPLAQNIGLSKGKKRIYVMFSINTDNTVRDIKTKSKNETLTNEAIRVIEKLPKFVKPAKFNGEAIIYKMSVPITFTIN